MKAVVVTKYGNIDVLQIKDIQKPVVIEGGILIRIEATVAAFGDCAFRSGKPYVSRLFTGLIKPVKTPGDVFAGVVEQVGKGVTQFKVGDSVYGSSGNAFGTNAQYISLPENEAVAPMPADITFEDAAAVSEGSLTALPFLRDHAKLQKGQKILINGACGGVGVYAVQLAKYFGADVTGVCGPANVDFVRSIGADHVIDYTSEDFTQMNKRYDVIFDAVAKSTFSKCKKSLLPYGIYLNTVPSVGMMLAVMTTSKSKGKKACFAATGLRTPKEKKQDLLLLNSLIMQGMLKAVVGKSFFMEDIADAHKYVETGHKRGSAVVRISSK